MTPGKYNMICPQGSTFNKKLTYHIDESPVNLTTYTARMQVRETHSSQTKVFDLTTENGRIVLGGALGTIDINIPATDTASVIAKNYVYDLELVEGSVVTRIVEGQFMVTPEVTR
jgi:molybdopterin-binding protein